MTKIFPRAFFALAMVCALLGGGLLGGVSLAHAETVTEGNTTTSGENLQIAVSVRSMSYVSSASANYGWILGTNFAGNAVSGSKLIDNLVYGRWYDSTTPDSIILELNAGQRVDNFTVKLNNNSQTITSADSKFYARISWSEYHLNTGFVGSNADYCNVTGFKLEIADDYNSSNPNASTWYDCGVASKFNPLVNVTYFTVGSITRTLSSTSTAYYDPHVTTINTLNVQYGDSTTDNWGSVWIRGVNACWGYTMSTSIYRNGLNTVANGSITDDSLNASGYDSNLSSDGTKFDKVGIAQHKYTIKDSHSISTETQYAGDNTYTEATRDIVVSGTAQLAMTYTDASGTEQTYDSSTWMAPSGTNADSDRKHAIDVTAYSTNAGTYTVQLKQENASGTMEKAQEQDVTNVSEATSRTDTTAKTVLSYSTETTTSGKSFSAILLSNYNNFKDIELSAETAKLTLFIDNTAPTVDTSTAKTNFAQSGYTKIEGITVTDALSGADGAYYTLVKHADDGSVVAPSTPTDSDWASVDNYTAPTEAGTYSVYVYGKDKATNRTNAELLGTFTVKEVKFAIVGGTWDGSDAATKTISIVEDSNGDFVLAASSIPDVSTAVASSGYDQTTGAWDVTPAAGTLTFTTGELTKTYTYAYQAVVTPTPTPTPNPTPDDPTPTSGTTTSSTSGTAGTTGTSSVLAPTSDASGSLAVGAALVAGFALALALSSFALRLRNLTFNRVKCQVFRRKI